MKEFNIAREQAPTAEPNDQCQLHHSYRANYLTLALDSCPNVFTKRIVGMKEAKSMGVFWGGGVERTFSKLFFKYL
jgi:hypothetical protein